MTLKEKWAYWTRQLSSREDPLLPGVGATGRAMIRRRALVRHWAEEPEIGRDAQGRWRAAWEVNRVAWVKTTSFPSSKEAEAAVYLTVGRIFGVAYVEGD